MNKLLRNIIIVGMLITEAVFYCAFAQTKVSFAYDTDFLLYFEQQLIAQFNLGKVFEKKDSPRFRSLLGK